MKNAPDRPQLKLPFYNSKELAPESLAPPFVGAMEELPKLGELRALLKEFDELMERVRQLVSEKEWEGELEGRADGLRAAIVTAWINTYLDL